MCDGFPKLFALLRIRKRRFISAPGNAQRQGCNGDSSTIQYFHRLMKSVTYLPQPIGIGYPALIEDHFGGLAATHAQLVFFFAG